MEYQGRVKNFNFFILNMKNRELCTKRMLLDC